jgi:hypothetical protein
MFMNMGCCVRSFWGLGFEKRKNGDESKMRDVTMLALAFFIRNIEERESRGWVEYVFLDVATILLANPEAQLPYSGDFSRRFKKYVAKLKRETESE